MKAFLESRNKLDKVDKMINALWNLREKLAPVVKRGAFDPEGKHLWAMWNRINEYILTLEKFSYDNSANDNADIKMEKIYKISQYIKKCDVETMNLPLNEDGN